MGEQKRVEENRQLMQASGQRWIWIMGLIVCVEVLNLSWLNEWVSTGVRAAISVILIAGICYSCSRLYRIVQGINQANLAEQHDRLAGKLESLQLKMQDMDQQMLESRQQHAAAFEKGSLERAHHAERITEQMNRASELMRGCVADESMKIMELTSGKIEEAMSGIRARIDGNQDATLAQFSLTSQEWKDVLKKSQSTLASTFSESTAALQEHAGKSAQDIIARIERYSNAVAEIEQQLLSLVKIENASTIASIEALHSLSMDNVHAIQSLIGSTGQEIRGAIQDSQGAISSTVRETAGELEAGLKQEMSASRSVVIDEHRRTAAEQRERMERDTAELQQRIAVLQQEALDRIIHSVTLQGEAMSGSIAQRNRTVDDKFGHLNKQVSSMTSVVGDKLDDLRTTVAKTLAVTTSVSESNTVHHEHVVKMIGRVIDLDAQWAEGSKLALVKQEESVSRLGNLESQLSSLHALVAMLRSVVADNSRPQESDKKRQQERDRVEQIRDDANGLLLINTYRDDVLRESEMHRSGKKIYMANYDANGVMISSQNFDMSEELVTELLYYPNGAVKERREAVKENGRKAMKSTKFTDNGMRK
jgi:hypothetical protein